MKTGFKSCIFILILLSLTTVVYAEKITLITDDFWNSQLEAELYDNPIKIFNKELIEIIPFLSRKRVFIEGKRLKVQIIDTEGNQNDFDRIKKAIDDTEGFIILSPLFASYACELASACPDNYFLVPSMVEPADCGSDNISFYAIDYHDACFSAGIWAAQQSLESAGIFYTGSSVYRRQAEAFKKGWASVRNIEDIKITDFKDADDTGIGMIDQFMEDLPGENGLAAIFAGPLNDAILDRFDGSSTELAGVNLRAWPEAAYNFSASVELGIVDMLTKIIKSVRTGIYMQRIDLKAEFFLYDRE